MFQGPPQVHTLSDQDMSGCPCLHSACQALGAERKSDLHVYPDTLWFQGQPSTMTHGGVLRSESWLWCTAQENNAIVCLSLLLLRAWTSCFLLGNSPSSAPSPDSSNTPNSDFKSRWSSLKALHTCVPAGDTWIKPVQQRRLQDLYECHHQAKLPLCWLYTWGLVKAGISVAILWLWGDKAVTHIRTEKPCPNYLARKWWWLLFCKYI